VIPTTEGTRPFNGDQVKRFLHNAEDAGVARIVGADAAAHFISDMAAHFAGSRLFPHRPDCAGECLRVGERRAQDVKSQSLSRTWTNAGEAGERFD
jgi:hypothetical protein